MPTCVCLISDYNRSASTLRIAQAAWWHGCDVHVVSKSDTCDRYDARLRPNCTAMLNRGRDVGTALEWVKRSYDRLPDRLVFLGSTIAKHQRERRLGALLRGVESDEFDCVSTAPAFQVQFKSKGSTLRELRAFRARRWQRRNLTAASPAPFGDWFQSHVGSFAAHADDVACFNVIFRSTRALLRRHPPSFYANLARQVNVADQAEAVHFAERALGTIFGNGSRRTAAASAAASLEQRRRADRGRPQRRAAQRRAAVGHDAIPRHDGNKCTWGNGCCQRHRRAESCRAAEETLLGKLLGRAQ